MAATIIIANKKVDIPVSIPDSFNNADIVPAASSNKASILKTLPGYLERFTIQLLAATAATKRGREKRFIQTRKCAFVTTLKTKTTKFPVTCAENKRLAQTKVVVSAYPATKLNNPLIRPTFTLL